MIYLIRKTHTCARFRCAKEPINHHTYTHNFNVCQFYSSQKMKTSFNKYPSLQYDYRSYLFYNV